jgi:hypothetical protein
MPRAQQLPAAFGVSGSGPQHHRAPTTCSTYTSTRHRRILGPFPLWFLAAIVVVNAACGGVSNGRNAGGRALAGGSDRRAVLVSTEPVVTVPNTIDDTGATDVTNALQSFIDQVDNGSDVQFQHDGSYRVEGTLFVTDKTLTFDGEGSTFFATTRGTLERSLWWVSSGGGLIFRNLTVRGANPYNGLSNKAYNPALAKQHGFRIEGVDGIELDHVTVTNVYGDFVYVARYAGIPSTDVWIHNSTFVSSGRQGISLIATDGVIIEHNSFSEIRRGTIDLEPDGPNQSDTNIFVLNNSVGSGRLLFIASHGKGPVDGIVVSGNRLHGHSLTVDDVPPTGERRENWIVTNNTSDTISDQRPIRFVDTDGLLVSGNTQPVPAAVPSVELDNDCGAQITGNAFGSTKVLQQGKTCSAVLTVPQEPVIPGRP